MQIIDELAKGIGLASFFDTKPPKWKKSTAGKVIWTRRQGTFGYVHKARKSDGPRPGSTYRAARMNKPFARRGSKPS